LAELYRYGEAGAPDYTEAVRWYSRDGEYEADKSLCQ